MELISETDMSQPRTPSDLANWVAERCEALGASKDSRIYGRSNKPMPKKFWEEVRPFSTYSSSRYGDRQDVICTPNLGNDNYDASIEIAAGDPCRHLVEVTYAKDGYDERLRLDALNSHGSVNALGHIDVLGTKASGTRTVKIANEAVNRESVIGRGLDLVKARIREKCEMPYTEDYILLVVVDDGLVFKYREDRTLLEKICSKLCRALKPIFSEIALVGESGTYVAAVHKKI